MVAITAAPELNGKPGRLSAEVAERPRIGFLWGYYQAGQRCLFRQATHSRKFLPVIFTRDKPEVFAGAEVLLADLSKGARPPGAFFERLYWKYVGPGRRSEGRRPKLAHAVRESGAKLLHVFQGNKAIKALPDLRQLEVPVSVSFHGNDLAQCLHEAEYRRQLPELFELAASIMVRSEHMGKCVREMGCPGEKIWLNRTGIPVERFPCRARDRSEAEPLHLIQVCRLVAKKGLFDTLAAFDRARKALGGGALLWIAGEGELREGLEQKIGELGLADSVKLLGFLEEEQLVEALGWADVYLQPSVTTESGDQEGIPNAMLEAMLTGLAPITTRHAGIPEVISEGRTGWLVREHGVEELAQRMIWCAEHRGELREMGLRARAMVEENFSLEKRIALLDEKYSELIQAHRRRPAGDWANERSAAGKPASAGSAKRRLGYLWGRPKLEERCIFRQITGHRQFHPVVFARPPVDIFEGQLPTLITFEASREQRRKRGFERFSGPDLQGMTSLQSGLYDRIDEAGVELLHVFYGDKAVNYFPALAALKIPVTVSFHGRDVPDCLHQPELRAMLPALFDFVSLVMVRSEYMGQKLLGAGCPPSKLYVQRTGIPVERFPFSVRRRPPGAPVVFLQVCRLIAKKGLPDTLAAFAQVVRAAPEARLWIAGKGDLEEALKVQIEQAGLGGSVQLLGYLDEPQLLEALRSAHVFVHPSVTTSEEDQEGIPNAMLEAMASGLVPITTRHAGIPEAVTDSQTGWLVDERAVDQLTERMVWCARHPEQLEAMSRAARRVVETDYALEIRTAELEKKFLEVIQERRPAAQFTHV